MEGMNVYQKLQKARVELQNLNMKKGGKNAFAKYDYYELGDILPNINAVMDKLGLCSVVSFTAETATLRIINTEKPDEMIEITSPMSEAALKGCHPVQNVGACETYQRRYLYMAAFEIVEADVLDATNGKEPPVKSEYCEDCGQEITGCKSKTGGNLNAQQVAIASRKVYGKTLCAECAADRKKAKHGQESA